MSDWLFDMIKKNLAVPADTPYEQWMGDFLRENVVKSEARAKSRVERDTEPATGVLADPEIQAALQVLRGDAVEKTALREDAAAVLADEDGDLPEDLAEILNRLDAYTTKSEAVGAVIKSLKQAEPKTIWASILKDQLTETIEATQRTLNACQDGYAQLFGNPEKPNPTGDPEDFARAFGNEST